MNSPIDSERRRFAHATEGYATRAYLHQRTCVGVSLRLKHWLPECARRLIVVPRLVTSRLGRVLVGPPGKTPPHPSCVLAYESCRSRHYGKMQLLLNRPLRPLPTYESRSVIVRSPLIDVFVRRERGGRSLCSMLDHLPVVKLSCPSLSLRCQSAYSHNRGN